MTGLHRATFSSHTDELLVVCVPFNSKKRRYHHLVVILSISLEASSQHRLILISTHLKKL